MQGGMLSLATAMRVPRSIGTSLRRPERPARRRARNAQAGRECCRPQNVSLGSACRSECGHVGLGLGPAVPSWAFS